MVLLYILSFFILLIIIFFLYVRLKYQFWAIQPVFHFYDLYYWVVNVGIIRTDLPKKNRYTNFNEIETHEFEKLNEIQINNFTNLIQFNYLKNKENTFSPKKDNILPYFIGHNEKTYWTFYYKPEILIDNKNETTIMDKKLVAVITCRPLHIEIININKFDVYYVDYLCVDKKHRKKNIAPEIIQTHEYNQSHLNKKICVSLFKREEELTGIIPLTIYKTYCFDMKNWNEPQSLSAKIKHLIVDKQNIYYMHNFINENKNKWDITIMTELSNIIELVESKNIYINMLLVDNNIVSIYILKKTCTSIEKDKEIISCIASINGTYLTRDDFVQGFKISLWSIIKTNDKFKYLTIEDLSDNRCIIDSISLKTAPIIVSPCAYFFYNFAYTPFKSEKVLIIN
jgi:hypothetical protein